MAHLTHLCECGPPASCDCATDFMEGTSMVYTAPYRTAEARGCVPKRCTCGDGGERVDAPSSRVYMEPMVELLNRVLKEKITLVWRTQ